jgi:hypothetical protein
MGASPIVKWVYREHIARFGEPDRSIVYEDHGASEGRPARIDIFVWEASAETDVTMTVEERRCDGQRGTHWTPKRLSQVRPEALSRQSPAFWDRDERSTGHSCGQIR